MQPQAYDVTFRRDEQGVWLVEVPALPGVHSFGDTLSEARTHILDALALWLEHEDFLVNEHIEAPIG